MRLNIGKTFPWVWAALLFFAALTFGRNHLGFNGTWTLIPSRGEFAGETVVETGTVTINSREHNIYISRNYAYDGTNQTHTYNFSTDGRENSTIRNGKSFKSKAKWEGDTLLVTTTEDNIPVVERYSLEPDGTLRLVVDRPGKATITLYFQRQ